jgi:hypothetical protein
MITRRTTQVIAWSTMPRSVTQWRPKASPEGPRDAGIGQRWAPRPRDYISLGRSHPATGSHLPMEGTAPPSAVAPDFTATQRDEALRAVCFVRLLAKGIDHSLRRLSRIPSAKPPSRPRGIYSEFLSMSICVLLIKSVRQAASSAVPRLS